MKCMTLAAVTGLLFLLPACRSDAGADTAAEARRVLAMEDAYVQAEIHSDEAALRRIVDDRFVFHASDGTTSGKEDLITMAVGWDMTGQTISERSVVVAGETAVIFGTTELRFASEGGGETVSRLRYTATYTKEHGAWRFLALQMTRRTPAP